MSKTVLLTGATGFIGSHLASALFARGDQVRAAVRATSRREELEKLGIEVSVVDFHSRESWHAAVRGCDSVFHLAGAVAGTTRELMSANRDATAALSAACAMCEKPPKLLFVSSLSAAGPAPKSNPRDVSDPPEPTSDYGRSKLAGEIAALGFAQQVPLTIIRPGVVFGPRDKEFVRLLNPIVRWGINPMAGWHNPEIGFVHVEDLVSAILIAEDRGSRCQGPLPHSNGGKGVYFVTDPETMSLRELGFTAGKAVGRSVRVLRFPLTLASLAAGAASACSRLLGKRTTFNPDKIREAAAPGWTCNVTPTIEELGWKPLHPLPERVSQLARELS